MLVREGVERVVDEVAVRLRPLQLLELRHALVVLHALRLHLRHLLGLELVELLAQHRVRVLEDRLDQRQHVQRVGRRLAIEQRGRVEQVQRQRVVQREVALQQAADLHHAPAQRLVRDDVDDAGVAQRPEARRGPPPLLALLPRAAVRTPDHRHQPPVAAAARRLAGMATALQARQQHAVRDVEARLQRLGRAVAQALEGAASQWT